MYSLFIRLVSSVAQTIKSSTKRYCNALNAYTYMYILVFGRRGYSYSCENERWGVDTIIVSIGVWSGGGINIAFDNYCGTRIKIADLNCKFVLRIDDSKYNAFVLLYVLRIFERYFLPTQALNSIYFE